MQKKIDELSAYGGNSNPFAGFYAYSVKMTNIALERIKNERR
jgi:hypothetical protein